jgi:hypothetical protein
MRALRPLEKSADSPGAEKRAVGQFWDTLSTSSDFADFVPPDHGRGGLSDLAQIIPQLLIIAAAAVCMYFSLNPALTILVVGALSALLGQVKNTSEQKDFLGKPLTAVGRQLSDVAPLESDQDPTWGQVATALNRVQPDTPAGKQFVQDFLRGVTAQDPNREIDPQAYRPVTAVDDSRGDDVPPVAREERLDRLASESIPSPPRGADDRELTATLSQALKAYEAAVVERLGPAKHCTGRDALTCLRESLGEDVIDCAFVRAAIRRGYPRAVCSKFGGACGGDGQ